MSKISTERIRYALNGATMGTRWSAVFFASPDFDVADAQVRLQGAVDTVDVQMSLWRPDSALVQLNQAPVGEWIGIPDALAEVLALGLAVGRSSHGAFDMGVGDAVSAWGFGPAPADGTRIRRAAARIRRSAHDVLALDGTRVLKREAIALDLNGIAKGYGVDCLAATLRTCGVDAALVGIDGEMRAMGVRPDEHPWQVAVESPEFDERRLHSVLSLHDAAVATSGDYRHWVQVQGCRLSHTMDPARGAPLRHTPASVTVVAPSCALADAWATAFMVQGPERGNGFAAPPDLSVLFLMRRAASSIEALGSGPLFEGVSRRPCPPRPSTDRHGS